MLVLVASTELGRRAIGRVVDLDGRLPVRLLTPGMIGLGGPGNVFGKLVPEDFGRTAAPGMSL